MIGIGSVSYSHGKHVVQQTRLAVCGMSGRRFVLILMAGMMKDQADLITFSARKI
jgi:hypothetical protein